ncbi:hypothetical protein, partial [Enterobacter kobei]|uniref:hypothetical protein n=4 Tax=Enterobacter kobei TaxID=208224 RepID=UPI0020032D56
MSLVRFRVRAPLFKKPSLWLGFCFSAFINPFFYILASLSGKIAQSALPDGGFALSAYGKVSRRGITPKAKNPAPYGTGFFYLMPGSSLLSHGETPH